MVKLRKGLAGGLEEFAFGTEVERHEASARAVSHYDFNNTYQYVINREETHLSWLQNALAEYKITYLAGYPSALQALAHEVVRLGRRDLRMIAVYANAEPVLPEQRDLIAEAFHCPMRESYGMTEGVAAGGECGSGTLHQWPEFGLTAESDRQVAHS